MVGLIPAADAWAVVNRAYCSAATFATASSGCMAASRATPSDINPSGVVLWSSRPHIYARRVATGRSDRLVVTLR
jgi:hypothetical protein